MAQRVENLPAVWETWVQFLSWDDPLGECMVTHCSILPGESLRTEEPDGLQSTGLQRVGHGWVTKHRTQYSIADMNHVHYPSYLQWVLSL